MIPETEGEDEGQKTRAVQQIFTDVADRYDLMNDLMSIGLHRHWKQKAIRQCAIMPGHQLLDVAGGTGDMSLRMLRQLNRTGHVMLTDLNPTMLDIGERRLIDEGYLGYFTTKLADAEHLDEESRFDTVLISFGLRNVTHMQKAMQSMYQAIKPGGKLVILEFTQPTTQWFKALYDLYSSKAIPKLGACVTGQPHAYQYLVDSIRQYPCPDMVSHRLKEVGFCSITYTIMHQLVTLHRAFKS